MGIVNDECLFDRVDQGIGNPGDIGMLMVHNDGFGPGAGISIDWIII
jgi:hypothetical protein